MTARLQGKRWIKKTIKRYHSGSSGDSESPLQKGEAASEIAHSLKNVIDLHIETLLHTFGPALCGQRWAPRLERGPAGLHCILQGRCRQKADFLEKLERKHQKMSTREQAAGEQERNPQDAF